MLFRPWVVGVFVLSGLVLLLSILFIIGDRQKAFAKTIKYKTQFTNLSGLSPGAKVRVSGIDAGKIERISIPHTASEKFDLTLAVDEKMRAMVRTDSVTTIETEGVVGDKYILVGRGSDRAETALADATLPSKEPIDISAMMEKANGLLADVRSTIGDVRGRVDTSLESITRTVDHADGLIVDNGPNIKKITRDGSHITGNFDSMVADMKEGKGPAGLILRDETTRQQLQNTMSNVQQTAVNANDVANRADQMIVDFQSRNLPEATQATLENTRALTDQMNTTLREALSEDTMGENAASNIRQSLANVNRSTANLADDTEALKHNFLIRGFFKKRGFFSTDQITPADYRAALAHRKTAPVRMWLDAANLTSYGADGREELTAEGRRQIDAAVAPQLNVLAGKLIVVEGYSTTGPPAEQSDAGRRRADQVRRYLEVHYHLRHSDIGVVALGSTPPQESGRASWDGAAIVLLETKPVK